MIGGGKEKREKRATIPREQRGREGLLVIRQKDSEQVRVRERACTYFMGQDFMTV